MFVEIIPYTDTPGHKQSHLGQLRRGTAYSEDLGLAPG